MVFWAHRKYWCCRKAISASKTLGILLLYLLVFLSGFSSWLHRSPGGGAVKKDRQQVMLAVDPLLLVKNPSSHRSQSKTRTPFTILLQGILRKHHKAAQHAVTVHNPSGASQSPLGVGSPKGLHSNFWKIVTCWNFRCLYSYWQMTMQVFVPSMGD